MQPLITGIAEAKDIPARIDTLIKNVRSQLSSAGTDPLKIADLAHALEHDGPALIEAVTQKQKAPRVRANGKARGPHQAAHR